ncbi:hypothetical protein HDU93_005827, partial [Gonapodya sp. JEL0774]
ASTVELADRLTSAEESSKHLRSQSEKLSEDFKVREGHYKAVNKTLKDEIRKLHRKLGGVDPIMSPAASPSLSRSMTSPVSPISRRASADLPRSVDRSSAAASAKERPRSTSEEALASMLSSSLPPSRPLGGPSRSPPPHIDTFRQATLSSQPVGSDSRHSPNTHQPRLSFGAMNSPSRQTGGPMSSLSGPDEVNVDYLKQVLLQFVEKKDVRIQSYKTPSAMSAFREPKRIAPEFDGNPSRHRDWMNKFELAARAAKYTDEDKCLQAPLHFDGDAWRWYQGRLPEEKKSVWSSFKAAFMEEFRGSNWQQNLLQMAMNRMQSSSESVDRYLNDKLDILEYLDDEATESTKIALLIGGLQQRYQPFVRMMAPDTLSKAISVIRTVAESFSERGTGYSFDQPPNHPRSPPTGNNNTNRNDNYRPFNNNRDYNRSYNDNRDNYQARKWVQQQTNYHNPNNIPIIPQHRSGYERRPNNDLRQQPNLNRAQGNGHGAGTDSDLARRLDRLSLNQARLQDHGSDDNYEPRYHRGHSPSVRLIHLRGSNSVRDTSSEYDSDDEGEIIEEYWDDEEIDAFVKRGYREVSSEDEELAHSRQRSRRVSQQAFPSDLEMEDVPLRRRYNVRRGIPSRAQPRAPSPAPPLPHPPAPPLAPVAQNADDNRRRRSTPKKKRRPHEYDIIKVLAETPANASLLQVIQLKPTMLNDVKHTLYDYIPREGPAEVSHADVSDMKAPAPEPPVAKGRFGTAKARGTLNGKDGNFIIDTGATNTIATIDTAEEYKLKCVKIDNPIPYHTSGEELGEVIAIARKSLIQFGGVGIRVDVYVVKSKGFKVLVGNDWLHAAKAKIDFEALTLTVVSAEGTQSTMPLKVRREENHSKSIEGQCVDLLEGSRVEKAENASEEGQSTVCISELGTSEERAPTMESARETDVVTEDDQRASVWQPEYPVVSWQPPIIPCMYVPVPCPVYVWPPPMQPPMYLTVSPEQVLPTPEMLSKVPTAPQHPKAVMQTGMEIRAVEDEIVLIHDFQQAWTDTSNLHVLMIQDVDLHFQAQHTEAYATIHDMERLLVVMGERLAGCEGLLSVIHRFILPPSGLRRRVPLARTWLTQFHNFVGPWIEDAVMILERIENLRKHWAISIIDQGWNQSLLHPHEEDRLLEAQWSSLVEVIPDDGDPRETGIDPWAVTKKNSVSVILETIDITSKAIANLQKQRIFARGISDHWPIGYDTSDENLKQNLITRFMVSSRTSYTWFHLALGILTQMHLAWEAGEFDSEEDESTVVSEPTLYEDGSEVGGSTTTTTTPKTIESDETERAVFLFRGSEDSSEEHMELMDEELETATELTCYDYHQDTVQNLGTDDFPVRPILGVHVRELENGDYDPPLLKCRNRYLRAMKLALSWPEASNALQHVRGLTSSQVYEVLVSYPTPWTFEILERFLQVVDDFVALRKTEIPGYGIEYSENFYPSYTRSDMQRRRVFRSVIYSVTHRLREYAVNQHLPFEWTEPLDSSFLRTKNLVKKVEDSEATRKAKPLRPGPVETAEYAPDQESIRGEDSDSEKDSDIFDLANVTGVRPIYGRDADVRSGILRPSWVRLPSREYRPMAVMLEFPEDCTPRVDWEYSRRLTAPDILVLPTPLSLEAVRYFLRAVNDFWKGDRPNDEVIEVLMMENLEPLVRLSRADSFVWEKSHDTTFIRAKRLVRKVLEIRSVLGKGKIRPSETLSTDERELLKDLSVHLWDTRSNTESTVSSLIESDDASFSDFSDATTDVTGSSDEEGRGQSNDYPPIIFEAANMGIDSEGEDVLLDDEDPMDPQVRMKQLRRQVKDATMAAIVTE